MYLCRRKRISRFLRLGTRTFNAGFDFYYGPYAAPLAGNTAHEITRSAEETRSVVIRIGYLAGGAYFTADKSWAYSLIA